MTALVEAARTEPIPRGPRPHLLAGNLPEWGRDPLAFLSATAREYGDVVPLRFGPTQGLLVNRADYVEAVLVTQGRSFRKPPAIRRLNAMIGNGLVASEGDFWLRQRRLAQPAFHRQRIADYGEVMVDRADRMLDGWAGGDVRDLHQEMKALTLDIVAKVLFDTEVAADVRTVADATDTLFHHFQGRLNSLLFLLPDALPTPGNRRMWRAVRRLEALIARIVDERRASDEEHSHDRADLLSMLLAARDADGAPMTDRQLRDEVMTLLLAGHETTALTLSWCWYLLAQHPDAERRLHAELRDVLGDDTPTAAHVPQLPYAEAIVNEVLRLYPPAWLVGREAVRNVPLGPYCVRKGTTVVISPWLLHRDARYFDDPASFRPGRWLDGLARQLPRGTFIPFGAGPRLCIGAGFAMTEAVLLLARVAQRYRLRLVPGPAIEPQTGITLRPGGSVRMRLEARGALSRAP